MKMTFASNGFGAVGLALCVLSCKPAGEGNSPSLSRPPTASTASARESEPSPPSDETADAGDSAVARYARREWVITRGNGTVVFEAAGEWACKALPDKRPPEFTLILQQRDGESVEWTYYGVTETAPCHFAWSMPWLEPPKAACEAMGAEAFDRLYEELRRLSPHTIRSKKLGGYVSPHRGGWGIHMRWERVECNVSDILDTEVDQRDQQRFDAVQDLVRKAYQKPQ